MAGLHERLWPLLGRRLLRRRERRLRRRSSGAANVFTYNHVDNRRRDGGFYGGGGVFYGDDGYSRLTPARAPEGEEPQTHRRADEMAGVERPSANIIYLPDYNRGAALTRRQTRH